MTNAEKSMSERLLHTHHIFRGHQELLDDAVRNRAFYAALRKRVTGDSAVLDIGAGTGIWAIAAAMMGAKKVVAIEKDELLAALIQSLARENRVQDKVEIVEGDSRDIKLRREFDVLISETIGNLGFDEQIVPILIDARKRFLKRRGVLIPSSVALVAAPACLKSRSKKTPSGISLSCNYFNSLSLNIPVVLRDKSKLRIVADRKEMIRVELATIRKPPELGNLAARWKLKNTTDINCFAVWAEATLTDGVELSTLDTTSWSPIIYLIKPFTKGQGELEFKLGLSEKSNYWSASFSNRRSEETRAYSPVLAFASLNAHQRLAMIMPPLRCS